MNEDLNKRVREAVAQGVGMPTFRRIAAGWLYDRADGLRKSAGRTDGAYRSEQLAVICSRVANAYIRAAAVLDEAAKEIEKRGPRMTTITVTSECDIQKDPAWQEQYHCLFHSVWFRSKDEPTICPAGEAWREGGGDAMREVRILVRHLLQSSKDADLMTILYDYLVRRGHEIETGEREE